MLDRGFLRRAQGIEVLTFRQSFIGSEQGFVLTHLGVGLAQQRQTGVVGLAQLIAVHHTVEVADRRPRLTQLIRPVGHRLDQGIPQRRVFLLGETFQQLADATLVEAQQLFDGWFHVFWFDGRERRQGVVFEQRIGHEGGNLGSVRHILRIWGCDPAIQAEVFFSTGL